MARSVRFYEPVYRNPAELRADVRALLAEIERLQRLLAEHHAVGALDNALVGDDCPICKRADE